ncbi:unnamed protein product, partial [Choristocarpus tenellus]
RDNCISSLEGLAGLTQLQELRLDINQLTSLKGLHTLPSLTELSAKTNHITSLPDRFGAGLASCSTSSASCSTSTDCNPPGGIESDNIGFPSLQRLELYHNRICLVHPGAFIGLTSLLHLDLGRNHLSTLDGRALERCPALVTLVLSQNHLKEPPYPLRLPLLRELWLSGNRIETMGLWPSSILGYQTCSSSQQQMCMTGPLQKVGECKDRGDIQKTRTIGHVDHQGGNGGVWLPSLEVLHLEDNALVSMGGTRSLVGVPLLRVLDISFNSLEEKEANVGGGGLSSCLKVCRRLEELQVHDNPMTSCDYYVFNLLQSCPWLTHVDGSEVNPLQRWQAEASAVMNRGDLILPALL